MPGQLHEIRQGATWALSERKQPQIRIIVVDDQRLFRESLAGMLSTENDFTVVALASNGLEAVEQARRWQPDVILMDIKMPQMDGITALRQLKVELPSTHVLLLTTFTADSYVIEGLAAGASGYILKDTSAIGLISAVHAVYAGEQVTTPPVANRMMELLERRHTEKQQDCDGLTARELEILALVARGMVAKEIAHALAISEKTVRNHISNIYRKLDIYDRAQVVIYAMRRGLVELRDM